MTDYADLEKRLRDGAQLMCSIANGYGYGEGMQEDQREHYRLSAAMMLEAGAALAVLQHKWIAVGDALPGYGEPVLLAVGWPGQRRVVTGERNQSSDGPRLGEDYWWIYDAISRQRATADYIGLPTHWARYPSLPEEDRLSSDLRDENGSKG
mgnify:CR=1 FL=1